MQFTEQKAIRDGTAAVMIEWANSRHPPFTGDNVEEFKDAIMAAHIVADEGRLDLQRWVDAARRTGLSWTDVGDALGISKQAAQQRFKSAETDEGAVDEEGAKIVRFGATAFNEMAMMRNEGRNGNELINTGMLTLTFRSTEYNWEYRRRLGVAPMMAEMKAAGWTYVSSWLPFHYFKRRYSES